MDAVDVGIFLNGSYGVGKSSVLDHLGDRFAAEGRAFSLFDVDWFHRSWPPADGDPENVLTEAENMSTVWTNYRRSGPRTPIIAGVIASDADRYRYEAVFERPLRVVLLTASPAVAERRLRGRYDVDRTTALDWHLVRHAELAVRIAAGSWNDVTVQTDDLTPAEVAAIIVAQVAADLPGAATPPSTG